MGAEASHLRGLAVADVCEARGEGWALHRASASATPLHFGARGAGAVSVFRGEAAPLPGALWSAASPLEKWSNNLLKYRHPCILRYVTAWRQRTTLHLATEAVAPLALALPSQAPLQICVGLNDILRALVFLHDQAGMSHNDVSTGAVFVTSDGHWKLGGLQYLCAFKELTGSYLKQARIHRYDKGVDPTEDSQEVITKVDQYAFAVLVEDVFKGRNDDDVPHLKDFKKYCQEKLRNPKPLQRPPLSEVLQHKFFNHQFISIYKFLYFLPLKSEDDKTEFFSTLLESLRCFDEETVAKQLGGLLLSRLAMLDQTARKEVIPFVLTPRNGAQAGEKLGLFGLGVFREHVKPSLVQLFGVRDSQIRLLLLRHFPKYAHVFTHEELSQHVLPELLLGIKDTDDNLVASTLSCLAELIPILGASTVIGGKRSKIFNDGRPNHSPAGHHPVGHGNGPIPSSKSLKDFPCSEEISQDSNDSLPFDKLVLHERPSPVGGESIEEEYRVPNIVTMTESEETWSDWDNKPANRQAPVSPHNDDFSQINNFTNVDYDNSVSHSISKEEKIVTYKARSSLLQKAAIEAKKKLIDISELDIKTQKADTCKKGGGDDFDFFADMEPVIDKSIPTVIPEECHVTSEISRKLNFVPNEAGDESHSGWGEDWGDN